VKRGLRWLTLLVVVVLVVVFAVRAMGQRKARLAAAAAPASAPLAIDLAAGDLVRAQRLELGRTVSLSGSLKAVNTAVVKARIAAELQSLTVREGDTVKAGQVIGRLDTTEYELRVRQAEQTAVSARTQLDIARRALENNKALVAQGFISATGLETSVSTEAGAKAAYQAAMATADIARRSRADAVLVAPIGGVVSQRLAQPGERVAVDARLVEIVDLSKLELEAAVAPEDVGSVQIGQPARLQIDGLGEPALARVARINPSTQSGTRAVMVYLALQPQAGLRQGLFARGAIEVRRQTALVLPLSAVRVDQALPYVLSVADGRVARRSVVLGARGEARFETGPRAALEGASNGTAESAVEIVSGLDASAVVLRGTVGALRDGAAVRLPARASAPSPSPSGAAAVSNGSDLSAGFATAAEPGASAAR
jgi:membrane fusion protein, multidrug efflux system